MFKYNKRKINENEVYEKIKTHDNTFMHKLRNNLL